MHKEESSLFPKVNYVVIGQNIKAARVLKGMRQTDIATKLNISATHYSNMERGMRNISLDMLFHLCTILETTLEDLLDGAYELIRISRTDAARSAAETIDEEWLNAMRNIQHGCSEYAQQSMLDICRILANLDRGNR